jgi:hypothetical protein
MRGIALSYVRGSSSRRASTESASFSLADPWPNFQGESGCANDLAAPPLAAVESIELDPGQPRYPSNMEYWRMLNRCSVIAGSACIVVGTVWAGNSWMMMRKYAGTTEGLPVRIQPRFSGYSLPPSPHPFSRESYAFSVRYELEYEFTVNGKTYYAEHSFPQPIVGPIPIHYAPLDPTIHRVGQLTSPWAVLAYALPIGGALLFAGCYRKRMGREAHSRSKKVLRGSAGNT